MEKIGEIKARFAEAGERLKKASMRTEAESVTGLLENLEQTYREDTRSGVQALIRRSEKQRETLEKETARIYQLQQYERDYENEGLICGIDEVGRGPLAGPVVAGAVILPKNCEILYLNDSKQLSAEKREQLYDVILEHAVAVGIGIVSPQRIDEINILQATYEAMRQAIEKLNPQPAVLLNDAVRIPQVAIQQVPIIKGEAKAYLAGLQEFLGKIPADDAERLLLFGEQLYLMPEHMPATRRLHVLRPGLHLGTVKKNRLEPAHALALAISPQEACHSWNLSVDEARAYLAGQTFPAEGEKGWYLITVDGYSLGWGKLAGSVMKNHYPKGLRKLL